mgnify:FL=1
MIQKRPRIIPVLSIANQNLVKTIKFRHPTYLGDPINAIKIFNEKGVDELCILDIEASKRGRVPDFSLLKDMASEAFMPLSYGGGITNIEEIGKLFRIGFEKVIINTAFFENAILVSDAVKLFGSQSIVISIDAKKNLFGGYNIFICDGTKKISLSLIDALHKVKYLGAGEIIINSIDNDGMMVGYDDSLIRLVTGTVSIPVTCCGGASCLRDLKKAIYEDGAHAASAGSMFVYYGRKKAVLINFPTECDLIKEGIYQ